MARLTWDQAVSDYEKKKQSGNTTTSLPTSGMISWQQAADEYDQHDEEGYKALGQQRISERKQKETQREERSVVGDWLRRYNNIAQDVPDYWHRSRVESLIADYEGIRGLADQYGFQDSGKYLDQLNALMDQYTQWGNDAKSGWESYLATKDAEDKSWFEQMISALGGSADTTLPMAGSTQAANAYRQDTSYREPTDKWADDMKDTFGYLYSKDPEQAWAYAEELNNYLNAQDKSGQLAGVQDAATGSFWNGAKHTAGALLASPLGMADYLDALTEYTARGKVTEKGGMTPFEYSQAVTGGISENLNKKYGTLNENIPVIGGKGLGDVYGLGTSIAQSSLAGLTGGGGQALVTFFGSAAASGMDDAKARGATDEQAIAYGTLSGAAESIAEMIGVDNLMKIGSSATIRQLISNVLKQGAAEGIEEGLTTLMNNFSDQLVMQDKSNFNMLVQQYMAAGMSEDQAKKEAWLDMANDLAFDVVSGFVSGAVHAGPQTAYQTYLTGNEMRTNYGGYQNELVEQGLESAEGTESHDLAAKYKAKLDTGADLSGMDLYRLVQTNEQQFQAEDIAAIRQAASNRLTELGETGNVQTISTALAKQAAGQKLTRAERKAIRESKFGRRVFSEMHPDNINSGDYASAWTADIGTNRINADEYNRLVAAAQPVQEVENPVVAQASEPIEQETAVQEEAPAATIRDNQNVETVRENRTVADSATVPANDQQVTGKLTAEESSVVEEAVEEPVTLETASKKYGAQAGAMVHTYIAGQDVDKYDKAYQIAYNMGKSGVNVSYAMNSEATSYLTEGQRDLAYQAGEAAAKTAAHGQQAKNEAAANGKTERKKGTVKGEGVTISDLKQTFNDPQGRAYKYLSTVAEVTGIDIVLYKSEAGPGGTYNGSQGKFRWSEDKIYIDVNAGLYYAKDAGEAAKYAMLRTFAHEFTHFIEKWNPVQYNEFRRVVFDTLTERGENVHDLIEQKQAQDTTREMTYEQASREVVAEAMTDILPDANFVQALAEKHKSIFHKLLEKLHEFAENLRSYFNSIGYNRSKEANALKEQVGETVKYVDSIVKLFDNVAAQAVENYQQTVAEDEVVEENATTEEVAVPEMETTTTVSETESVKQNVTPGEQPVAQEEAKEPVTETYENGFTITDNVERGSLEISFDGKPSAAVRDAMKSRKFRWNGKKKVWYGFGDRSAIVQALNDAYESEKAESATTAEEQSDFAKAFWNASQEERDEVVDAIKENTNIAHVAPTEIIEEAPANKIEEVTPNGETENADNPGAVQQPDADRREAARLLADMEAGDVPGDGAERDAVADAEERGRETGRDDDRDGLRAGHERGHGVGGRERGDLRGPDRVTAEESTTSEPAAEPDSALHEEVVEQIAQQSTELPKGRNFVIGESLDLPVGEKSRYKANVDAIRLVKKLEAEGRYATEAEQVILSKYVGWGGLANAFDQRKPDWAKEFQELKELLTDEEYRAARSSTNTAFYTDISIIRAMYDGLAKLGFKGGRILEPAAGVGHFAGAMPADLRQGIKSMTMVELDSITGLIAKYLYPNADVRIQGFEKANIPNDFMDVAVGNVPFGDFPVVDKAYPKKVTSAIHNYFFAKTLDKVRPGGIVMMITSSYTMDSADSTVRNYISKKADLLGAIRLPNTAFDANSGTDVVSDILILKKRAAGTAYSGEAFADMRYGRSNEYFVNHPEMILGTVETVRSRFGWKQTVMPREGNLGQQIREALGKIEGQMEYPTQISPEKTNFAVERAGKKTKENGLVVKDGKVYKNTDGELVEQKVAKGAAERISGLLAIRDAAKALQTYQQQGLKDSEIRKARKQLNTAYDTFVKKYGFINSPANRNAIKDDPDKFSILALENYNHDTKKATKADIFSKNTIAPNRTVTSAKDVSEGLIVSVNQTGGVDAALIAQLTGKTEEDVTRELLDSRKVFKNRDGVLETAEVYLSGNVRAKLRDAEAMVPMDAEYQKNVDALKAVVPEDVGYQDIFVNPGTPWIPNRVYSDFAAHMLGTANNDWSMAVEVTRNPETGNFTVELLRKYLKTNSNNTQKWGTNRRSFLDLFDAMLNSKSVVVKFKTDDGKSVVDQDATAAANEKIEAIQKEFQEWLWKDESRRAELATLYNETFNAIVTPTYNGDNLTVNGSNALKPLRPHQRNAVQRIISSGGNTLLAHKVGAGKTYEMAAAAMKLKQLGLVKKPMFAVPKSLVAQWGNEFMDFFPTAKLLVAEANDFTAANRKVFANRIANGDYDAVILSYEQFERLPISADFARGLYQEQIDSIVSAIEEARAEKGGKSLSTKDLEKKRKQLEAKVAKLTDSEKDEDNINFEQLGVDSLFIDEAHNFKNLFYTTSMTNVSGLGNKDGSKRAFDLYTKVRYLQQLNGGRGIVFATATPVMNSMSEMYIMQKYLQPDLLDQLGLSTFDAWAKQFGEVVNGVEIKPSGQGYRVKQSFSRFKNMSELQLLFRNFADVLTEIPGLKIPKMKGGKVNVVVCDPGSFQQDYMKELEKRADNIKNVDPSVDNMLKITSDGRKISYTQRMIDPSMPYEEGCKIFRCADNVLQVYMDSKSIKGTQIIFCDMATPKGKSKTATAETEDFETDMESAKLYDDIKARLMKGGIPAKEIAFIHEADTDAKKKKLFADVNDGKVRVLIGSTGKMGVGMNAQKRIVAIHHLDAPWRPGDVEQRNGRAYRQGNINDEVENFTYVTEGSFDARLWDILERKQNFIDQVMNGENVGREVEDTGEVTLSAAEVKALASGSPLIMEQVQLDTDIKKLESLRRAHITAVANARTRLQNDLGNIATYEKSAENGRADLAARVDTYSEGKFSITVGKKKYTDKKEAGIALMAAATSKATEEGYTTIGKFAGFDLRVVKTHEGIKGLISGKQGYVFNTYPGNTTYMINHIIGKVESLEEAVKVWEKKLSDAKADMEEQRKLIAQPFAKQAELDKKRARYNAVMEILNPKEEQAVGSMDEDTEQHQSREYLAEVDSDGNELSEEQRAFFAQSKMRNEFGRLKVMYHGTDNAGFTRFMANYSKDLRSFFFTDRLTNAASYSGTMEAVAPTKNDTPERKPGNMAVYLDIKNPLYIDTEGDTWDYIRYEPEDPDEADELETFNWDTRGLAKYAKSKGYDGLILESLYDYGAVMDVDNEASTVAVVFKPEQIKSINNSTPTSDPDIRYQQRTDTLTDREVLTIAAERVVVDDLTQAEKDALDIFQKRLAKLEALQEERAEQGRLYKEQQFGAKVDREKAAETLARMHTLDSQIQKASADVLSVEEKTVLKRVLQKARKVVEQEQRKHDEGVLKRYRERRKDAAAIKKYRERIQKDVGQMMDWVLKPDGKNALNHIPEALRGTVIPFINSINMMSKRSLNGGKSTKADEQYLKRMEALRKSLRDDSASYYAAYELPPNFMDWLDDQITTAREITGSDTSSGVLNEMTAAELKSLSEIVRNLKQFVRNFNRLHANAMFQHVHEAGDSTISALRPLKADSGEIGGVKNFLFWQQIRPAYAFERFGNGGKAIYDGLRRGQSKLAFMTKEIEKFSERTWKPEEVKKWETEILELNLSGDIVRMTVADAMSFYELSKRPAALTHILGDGGRVATRTRKFGEGKDQRIVDYGHQFTEGDILTIADALTTRQKKVADAMQQYMSTTGSKWGNEVSMRRFGIEQFTEEHYFPINVDGSAVDATVDERPNSSSLYSLLNMGFTKNLTPEAKNRIIIYSIFDVFATHMGEMAQYNAMALPVLDAVKWLNYRQTSEEGVETGNVRRELFRVYGGPGDQRGSGAKGYAEQFIVNILRGYNGTEAQGSPNDSLGLKMLHRYNRAQVAFNLSVALKQPTSIIRAGMILDLGSILGGMKNPAMIRKNIEEMHRHSGIAVWKDLGFYDVNISRGLTSIIKQDASWYDKLTDLGLKGAEFFDTVTWAAIWSASKAQMLKKGYRMSDANFYDKVTELFEEVIYKTQVVDSILTKNEYMRDKGFFSRAVSSFMGEPVTSASMILDTVDKFNMDRRTGMNRAQAFRKHAPKFARLTAVYSLSGILTVIAGALAGALRDDDEYQTFWEKWGEAFKEDVWSELNPLGTLPFVSDVWDIIRAVCEAATGGDPWVQIANLPMADIASYAIDSVKIANDLITGEDTNYTWYASIYKMLQAASGLSGLPMAAFNRELVTLWNNIVGAVAPSLKVVPDWFVKVKTYDPGEKNSIKYAYLDGYLTAEEATAELLGKGIVETEDEAYWQIQEWGADEGYSKYDALHNAVLTGGDIDDALDELIAHGHTEKEVASELKGQIGEWYKTGQITKQQAVDMLTEYFELDRDEITSTVNKWSCVVVTGIPYEDIKDEYLDGNIPFARAVEMYARYGGYTQEKAKETVTKWKAEKETGVVYDEIDDAFMSGEISAADARNMYVTYGGYSKEDAAEKVAVMAFKRDYPELSERITYTQYKRWETDGKPHGVNVETFTKVAEYRGGDGSGSVKSQDDVAAYINALPITKTQKDALWCCFWKQSTLKNAPWNK